MNVLHDYWRSSASWRVRIALAIKGIEWQSLSHDLTRNEQRDQTYLKLNPQGLVPTWQETDGWSVGQSIAILEYLEECYPTPALLPDTPRARAEVRSLVQLIACDIHPLNNLRVTRHLREHWQADEPRVNAWVCHWMREGFIALEERARRQGSREHLHGRSLTLADVCLVPQLYNAKRFGCSTEDFPTLTAIGTKLSALPAFRDTHPQRHPAAPS
ncbi:MAG: maleylacetoacetate isomerase [Steroidobacteraceae bacterium]